MFFEEVFKIESVWSCGFILRIEGEAGDCFLSDIDGDAFANFQGDISFT